MAIWIIRLLRFPCQCCSLQMVPMPVSSQYRDQRCRQGGNLGNTYLTYQKNKIKTTGLIGLHQQANMAALYHESEFVWVCKLILYSSVFLPWELALSAITKAFAWKDDKKIAQHILQKSAKGTWVCFGMFSGVTLWCQSLFRNSKSECRSIEAYHQCRSSCRS